MSLTFCPLVVSSGRSYSTATLGLVSSLHRSKTYMRDDMPPGYHVCMIVTTRGVSGFPTRYMERLATGQRRLGMSIMGWEPLT